MLGLIAVPHLTFRGTGEEVARAASGIQIGSLSNANGLAGWFGFCVVFFGISGLETRRGIVVRILYGLAAVGSFLIVGLTISRGALLGCAIALTVGFRRFLKRAFLPALLLIIFAGVFLASGLFDQIIFNYEERGAEDTGRIVVWPLTIERILESPIVGVGISKSSIWIPEANMSIPPHNSFLFFALSSGIVPFALFVAFWTRAARRSFSDVGGSEYSPFRIPLLLYALVAFMLGEISVDHWAVFALVVAAGSRISHRSERLVVTYSRIRRRRIAPTVQLPSKAGTIR